MARSLVERLISGETITVELEEAGLGFAVRAGGGEVWIAGCDCSSQASRAEVKEIYELLGAWLRAPKPSKKD